jgi:23S rRNA (adenine2503-C2)-methyltransferase
MATIIINTHGNNLSHSGTVENPFALTFKEAVKTMGEDEARVLFATLYKNKSSQKPYTMTVKEVFKDTDTQKYVYQMPDKKCIETVCIKRKDGVTACASTQVGCAVGCAFCESGRNGLLRNLAPAEIVQQIVLLKEKVNRIIFMGIGEPLHNYDALIRAIHVLRDRNGLDFPTDGITVSTVGPVKQLKKLREEHIKIQLVLSLHSTDQKTRDAVIPGMRGNDIGQTVQAALSYSQRHNRKIIIAYLLLPGINDRPSDVRQLTQWFRHENIMINLLEYNRTSSGEMRSPRKEELLAFKNALESSGLETNIRVSHGRNIIAACGQLASKYNGLVQ